MCPMSLAQVWVHSIEFSFQTFFSNLFKFPTKIPIKSIVHILGLKIIKLTLLNQTLCFQSWFFKKFNEKMVQ
jgi:hypothetical protein